LLLIGGRWRQLASLSSGGGSGVHHHRQATIAAPVVGIDTAARA